MDRARAQGQSAAMRFLLALLLLLPFPAAADPSAVIAAARGQVGVTVVYDPAYASLAFPGGDIDRSRGVCTDVLIRALRDALGVDLQLAVNRDMKAEFAAYPRTWGLTRPDRNIDHRRVGNLATLLRRAGAAVEGAPQPGDILTVTLPGNLPHLMIVSDRAGPSGRPLVIHNVGAGTREEDRIADWPLTGHFRLTPQVLERLAALGR